eukprot:7049065-Pyramimonas_sp.AAC.2
MLDICFRACFSFFLAAFACSASFFARTSSSSCKNQSQEGRQYIPSVRTDCMHEGRQYILRVRTKEFRRAEFVPAPVSVRGTPEELRGVGALLSPESRRAKRKSNFAQRVRNSANSRNGRCNEATPQPQP